MGCILCWTFGTYAELTLLFMFSHSDNLAYFVSIKISKTNKKKTRGSYVPGKSLLRFAKFTNLPSRWLVFVLTTVYHSTACCFFCGWIWVKVKSQNWLNVEINNRKAVRNCGHDLSPNPPITLLPSIRQPNFTNQCWSSGTANDEMMSELLEGWKYMTRKRQVFPESQYECDRWSIGSYAWPYARSIGEIGIFG